MIVVSDTSPLNYLILIDAVDILPVLFDRVVVPESVASELGHVRAADRVRSWITDAPSWVDVLAPTEVDQTIGLHAGERDAICLALELKADLVLIDERAARRFAKERGLQVIGTLGALELADVRKLLDLPSAIETLRRTNYQIREDVLESLIDEHARRQSQSD